MLFWPINAIIIILCNYFYIKEERRFCNYIITFVDVVFPCRFIFLSVVTFFLPEKKSLIVPLLGESTSNEFSVFVCSGRILFHLHFWKDSFAGYKILVWNMSSYCPLTPLFFMRNEILILLGSPCM